jgi:hypothetical protein
MRTTIIPFALAAAAAAKPGIAVASAASVPRSSAPKVVQSDVANISLVLGPSKPSSPPAAKGWSVQIGAYASETLAEERLATFVRANAGTVDQAERLVTPFRSFDGRMLFRARFGPFAENEARDLCNGIIRRGQTCFATAQFR